MSALDGLALPLREALATHSLLESFGIPPSDIFVSFDGTTLQVIPRQGEKQATVKIATIRGWTPAKFNVEWDRAVRAWNAAPWSERDAIVKGSQARRELNTIVAGLILHGFESAATRRREGT